MAAATTDLFTDQPPDETVDYDSGDRPKYRALSHQITAFYSAMTAVLASYTVAMRHLVILHGHPEEPFVLHGRPNVAEHLTDVLLARLAGRDRTRDGFVNSPNGILQHQLLQSYVIGVQRAAFQMRLDPTEPGTGLTERTNQLLRLAFERLSDGGRLRLEQITPQVTDLLQNSQKTALTRLETMNQFQTYTDALASNDFQRISRTESVYGAIAGTSDQLQEYGVAKVRWIIGPNACPLCQEYEGREIEVDNWDELPPLHPNCMCSVEPVRE
jgi:hypothetical protein